MSLRNVKLYSYTSQVQMGGWCSIVLTFDYLGGGAQIETYCAIGNNGIFGFNEVISASNIRDIPSASSWTKFFVSALIRITEELDPAKIYDVYGKVREVGGGWNISDIAVDAVWFAGMEREDQTLEIDVSPADGGYVITNPASNEGKSNWVNGNTGTFPYGTDVIVRAVPYSGFKFDHWSDEIVGGVSTNNPAHVQSMTEHRAIKAHFVSETADEEKLIISITPTGKGSVTASPQPNHIISNDWYYTYGTIVTLTAHPISGWKFKKWSDEISGGVNTSNPAQVSAMTETRTVLCHFEEIDDGGSDDGGGGDGEFDNLSVKIKRA